MKFKTVAAAVSLLAAGLAQAAVVNVNAGAYTISYDNAAPSGFVLNLIDVSATGFAWSFKDVQVQSLSAGVASADLWVPDFTVTANAGWNLGNTLTSSVGNVVFFEFGPAATTTLTAGGTFTPSTGPAVVLPQLPLAKAPGSYFQDSAVAPLGNSTSFSVTNSKVVLTVNAGAGSFAAITAHEQNKLAYSFTVEAAPVPEPETYALMLAGLGMVGFLARRRQR